MARALRRLIARMATPAVRALILSGTLAGALAGAAHAGPQFVDNNGVADFGYDVVAYHTQFAARKGSPQFVATYNGVPFWFESAANRDRFKADPEAYAPAYDGHCAYAVSNNKKLTVDPEAFSIVDPNTNRLVDPKTYTPGAGVLYLNYDAGVNRKFNKDPAGVIARADDAWKDCLETLPTAKPSKGLGDLFGGSRPGFCPRLR
ncbi:MAG: YHS domain-containing (seleno)protein [Hyphomonadaceae bacterium]